MADVKSRDVDRGWAWVVLVAAMINATLCSGNEATLGIFQVEFFESFPNNHGFVSLIFSFAFGGVYLLGPVSGLLGHLYTCRVPVLIGGALGAIAMLLASFVYDLVAMLFVFGVGLGAGTGLQYTACVTVLGSYFNKYRTLAFGLLSAAPGIGVIVAPYLVTWLIDQYGWRLALGFFACISAQICVFGALFYPLDPKDTPACCCPKKRGVEKGGDPQMDLLKDREKESQLDSYGEETQLLPRPESTRRRIQALLQQKFLWVVCWNQMLVTAGFTIGFNFFPAYAESIGVSSEDVPTLYLVYGLVSILLRALGGFVFNVFPRFQLKGLLVSQLALSVSCGLLPFYGVSFSTLSIERVITAWMWGHNLLLVGPLLVHYLGPKNLSIAFGTVMLFSGVGSVASPAIAGVMIDIYGSFNACYYIAGGACALATLSLLLTPFLGISPSSAL